VYDGGVERRHVLSAVIVVAVALAAGWLWVPPGFRLGFAVGTALLLAGALCEAVRGVGDPLLRLLAPVALVLFLVALYHRVVAAWWMGDDTAILVALTSRGALAHLVDPSVWRAFSLSNFTPWVIMSFAADHVVAGLDPTPYYWHQLASLAVVLLVAYWLLTRFVSPATASTGLVLFIASVPVATVAQWLMTRHYVEGLALALAATGLYRRSVAGRPGWAWPGAGLYLLAASAKEVFVPLVVVLPLLPVGDLRARLRAIVPYAVSAAAYLAWRLWMLGAGALVSAYGSLSDGSGGALGGLAPAAATLGVAWWPELLVVALLLGAHLVRLMRERRVASLVLIAALAVITAAPLIPVLALLQPRMLLLAAFLLGVWLAVAAHALVGGRLGGVTVAAVAVLLLALGLAAVGNSGSWRDRTFVARYRVEGRYVLAGTDRRPLLDPVGPPWYYTFLATLRRLQHDSPAPDVCFDHCLCEAAEHNAEAVRFSGGTLRRVPLDRAGCCFRPATMDVSVTCGKDHIARWRLGPYADGTWAFVDRAGHAQSIPARGTYPLEIAGSMTLRFLYRSPEGWAALSPPLVIDSSAADSDAVARLSWRGAGVSR
jgi:hypothetical protein